MKFRFSALKTTQASLQQYSKKTTLGISLGVVFLSLPSSFAAPSRTDVWNAANRRSVQEADTLEYVDISPFSPESNNISLDVGQVFLLGSQYKDSLGFKLNYTYGVSETFGFNAAFGYSGHADGAYNLMSLNAGLRTNLTWYDKIVPNIILGLGFYRPSAKVGGGSSASSVTPLFFGVHLGAGVDLMLTRRFFFGTAITFHNMFGEKVQASNGTSVDLGSSFATFYLRTGVTF